MSNHLAEIITSLDLVLAGNLSDWERAFAEHARHSLEHAMVPGDQDEFNRLFSKLADDCASYADDLK